MAQADSDTTTATTDEGAGEAADLSTDTKGNAQSGDDAATSTATDKADDQTDTGEGSDDATGDEGAGDSASKAKEDKSQSDKAKQNREAGKLRLAQKNEKISELRGRLQTEYVDAAEDENDRKIRAIESDRYVERIERVNRDLQRDNEQAAREIPLFNAADTEHFDKDLLDRSLKRYARDCLTQDENGQITGYSIPLLDYLREEADGYGAGSKTQTPQQDASAKAKAAADAKKAAADKAKAEMDAASDATGGSSAAAAEAKRTQAGTSFDEAFLAGMDDPNARHKPADAHRFA